MIDSASGPIGYLNGGWENSYSLPNSPPKQDLCLTSRLEPSWSPWLKPDCKCWQNSITVAKAMWTCRLTSHFSYIGDKWSLSTKGKGRSPSSCEPWPRHWLGFLQSWTLNSFCRDLSLLLSSRWAALSLWGSKAFDNVSVITLTFYGGESVKIL